MGEGRKPPMSRIVKIGIFFVVMISFVGCDQLTKSLAKRDLNASTPSLYLNGVVRLEYAENPGLFMSIGASLPEGLRSLIHAATAVLVASGIILLLVKAPHVGRFGWLGACLLLAGACSNLLDRLTNDGRVIDFIIIDFGRLRTGVFNIADLLIMVGVVILLLRAGQRNHPMELTDGMD